MSKQGIEKAGEQQNRFSYQLRNIIEQANEWQASLYINFIDFEKAIDSIHYGGP